MQEERPRSESNETQSSADKQLADDACSSDEKPSRRVSTGMMQGEPLGSPRASDSFGSPSDNQLSCSAPVMVARAKNAVAKLRQSLELTTENGEFTLVSFRFSFGTILRPALFLCSAVYSVVAYFHSATFCRCRRSIRQFSAK